jgi:hypothetical protein
MATSTVFSRNYCRDVWCGDLEEGRRRGGGEGGGRDPEL